MTARVVVVSSALERRQVESYLEKADVEWVVEDLNKRGSKALFGITPSDAQWPRIRDWVERVGAIVEDPELDAEFARREAEAASDTMLIDTGTYFVRVKKRGRS